MFKFINAENTLQNAKKRENNLTLFDGLSRLLCFLMKIGPFKSKNWLLRAT